MADIVTISRQEYNHLLNAKQDLQDARDHAVVMAQIAAGAPVLTSAELDDYLAAPRAMLDGHAIDGLRR